jgi:CelD/BcsL family acetyltransferase involved in cellulose biosynthesis
MKVVFINSREGFSSLKEEWDLLYAKSRMRNPFLHYSWIINAIDSFFKGKKVLIATLRTNDNVLIAACPFVIEEMSVLCRKVKVLKHFNCVAADYSDFLISPSVGIRDCVKKIVDAVIVQDFELFKIDNLNSLSPSSKLFMKFMSEKAKYTTRYVNVVNPILEYSESDYLDKKSVKDVERRLNKLSKESEVSFYLNSVPSNEFWSQLVSFHKQNYDGVGFNSKEYQDFYTALLKDENYMVEYVDFSYMTLDGKVVAAHFGFKDEDKGIFYYYVPSYNNEHSKLGVGKMLLLKLVENYKGKNFEIFDFMRGSEVYKKTWMSDELQNFSLLGCKKDSSKLIKIYIFLWGMIKSLSFTRNGY